MSSIHPDWLQRCNQNRQHVWQQVLEDLVRTGSAADFQARFLREHLDRVLEPQKTLKPDDLEPDDPGPEACATIEEIIASRRACWASDDLPRLLTRLVEQVFDTNAMDHATEQALREAVQTAQPELQRLFTDTCGSMLPYARVGQVMAVVQQIRQALADRQMPLRMKHGRYRHWLSGLLTRFALQDVRSQAAAFLPGGFTALYTRLVEAAAPLQMVPKQLLDPYGLFAAAPDTLHRYLAAKRQLLAGLTPAEHLVLSNLNGVILNRFDANSYFQDDFARIHYILTTPAARFDLQGFARWLNTGQPPAGACAAAEQDLEQLLTRQVASGDRALTSIYPPTVGMQAAALRRDLGLLYDRHRSGRKPTRLANRLRNPEQALEMIRPGLAAKANAVLQAAYLLDDLDNRDRTLTWYEEGNARRYFVRTLQTELPDGMPQPLPDLEFSAPE